MAAGRDKDAPSAGARGAGATARRADYASTRERRTGAWVASVEEGSPAWEAGLERGMRIDSVDGSPLRDIIDWRWEASDAVAELAVFDPATGEEYACTLEREPGEDWGVEFEDVLFDGIRTCVNACQFCFMRMLPEDARASLMLRDDDYRLSFTQGNFVTLTNMTDEDVERVVAYRLEPMNVSIHAVSPEVRRSLIGPRADRGIEVLERLCEAGIEVHGQIVLCAGINDGDELVRTLDWVEARPQITSLAIVPMGYTKYSKAFSRSFSEDVEASRAVVRLLEPYQARARAKLGITRFQLSDEFYIDAGLPVPPAETYDGYPQFYDGIGMLRSFLDDAAALVRDEPSELARVARVLEGRRARALLVVGEAALGVVRDLCDLWAGTLENAYGAAGEKGVGPGAALEQDGAPRALPVEPLAIRNDYYGGDVNVTGLIVSRDLLAQLPASLDRTLVVLPEAMFNFDRLTLDGDSEARISAEVARRGGVACVSETSPRALLAAVAAFADGDLPCAQTL